MFSRYLNSRYFGLAVSVLVFISLTVIGFTKGNIRSEEDLVEVRGNLSKYSFPEEWNNQNVIPGDTIWLTNYSNPFFIKPEYLAFFKQNEFQKTSKLGHKVIFTIHKGDKEKLNSDEAVQVTSIYHNEIHYLKKSDVLKFEKELSDSSFEVVLAFVILLLGSVVFFIRK